MVGGLPLSNMSQPPAHRPSAPKPPALVRQPRAGATRRSGGRGALGLAFDAAFGVAQDTTRSITETLGGAAKALATPGGVVGAAVELAWVSTHLALYPFGLFGRQDGYQGHGYSLQDLPPATDVAAEARALGARLTAERAAPIGEEYTGPVLVESAPAPEPAPAPAPTVASPIFEPPGHAPAFAALAGHSTVPAILPSSPVGRSTDSLPSC